MDCQQILFSVVKIRLEGPFILLLNSSKANPCQVDSISAFVPKDPMMDDKRRHAFVIRANGNATPIGTDDGNSFSLSLLPDGLEVCNSARHVEQGFRDFNLTTDICDTSAPFVSIQLPCPDRIVFSRTAVPVVFESGVSGFMPMNHVLEYQVTQPNTGVEFHLKGSDGRDMDVCLDPAFDAFVLQVGLARPDSGTDPDPFGDHALRFFNEVLLKRVPKVTGKRLLFLGPDPLAGSNGSAGTRGTDVECRVSGLMATL